VPQVILVALRQPSGRGQRRGDRVPKELLNHGAAGAPVDVLKLDRAGLRQLRRRIGMIFQQFNLAKRLL